MAKKKAQKIRLSYIKEPGGSYPENRYSADFSPDVHAPLNNCGVICESPEEAAIHALLMMELQNIPKIDVRMEDDFSKNETVYGPLGNHSEDFASAPVNPVKYIFQMYAAYKRGKRKVKFNGKYL